MELKMIKLAVERLYDEIENLKAKNKELLSKIKELKLEQHPAQISMKEKSEPDELMDTKQVLNYLGICYNTLQSIIQKGLIKPIRINQRRVRFSRKAIVCYVRSLEKLE